MTPQRKTGPTTVVDTVVTAVRVGQVVSHAQVQKRNLSAICRAGSRGCFGRRRCLPKAMICLVAALLLVVPGATSGQEKSPDPDDVYMERLQQARLSYRAAHAQQIREAKRVVVFLLRFDDLREDDLLTDPEGLFPVAPYNKTTSVIATKEFGSSQAKELLLALADQIEKPQHNGGAFGHLPVHGVCVYSDEERGLPFDGKELFSASFCWVCRNFGYTYPDDGTEWLDTNKSLETIFNKLLPIPKEELERREKKFPTKRAGRQARHLDTERGECPPGSSQ